MVPQLRESPILVGQEGCLRLAETDLFFVAGEA
jgi:hypothetical protein